MEQFTFYELYADILQGTDDVSAGKLASNICAYEFEDREPDGEMTDKEHFYWSNIADILKEVKETERAGKKPKRYNLQSRHFTFYATYYNAMKLLNVRKRGIFVKAVCAYMFEDRPPAFEDKTIQGYFNLCKRKMDVSKKRKASGRTGGTREKKMQTVPPMTKQSAPKSQEIPRIDRFIFARRQVSGLDSCPTTETFLRLPLCSSTKRILCTNIPPEPQQGS